MNEQKRDEGDADETTFVERRPKPRVALRRPVRLRYRRFQDFIDAATRNISETGMLIHTAVTRPVGVEFDFSFALHDGMALVEGTAQVVWVNHDENGTPCGMGVKFLELTGESLTLVRKIVEESQQDATGGDSGSAGESPGL